MCRLFEIEYSRRWANEACNEPCLRQLARHSRPNKPGRVGSSILRSQTVAVYYYGQLTVGDCREVRHNPCLRQSARHQRREHRGSSAQVGKGSVALRTRPHAAYPRSSEASGLWIIEAWCPSLMVTAQTCSARRSSAIGIKKQQKSGTPPSKKRY